MLFYTGRSLTKDTLIPLAMNAEAYSNLTDLGPVLVGGNVWHRDKALVLAFTRSCEIGLASGLEVRLEYADGGTGPPPLYNNGLFEVPCPFAAPSCTPTQNAAFSGVDPGLVTVSAWNGATKVAEETILTRANSVTYLNWMFPLRGGTNR